MAAPTYYEKNEAKVKVKVELVLLGWRIFGFTDDKSDMMTDYYSPAHWEGVATKDGFVLCCGVYEARNSGRIPIRREQVKVADCEKCAGSGVDPSGWTLEAARNEPERYHQETDPPGTMSIMRTVVSPIPFFDGGKLKCRSCHGTGEIRRVQETPEPENQWPTYQANPPRCNWHLEKDGVILASGTGLWSLFTQDGPEWAEKFMTWYKKVLQAMQGPRQIEAHEAEGCTIQDGTREGFSEIIFSSKPGADVLAALRGSGFRWHNQKKLWYGPTDRIPEQLLAIA